MEGSVQVQTLEVGEQHISVRVKRITAFICTFVYASLFRTVRTSLWNSLVSASDHYIDPWLVIGYKGAKFTWCNNRQEEDVIWLCLDRFLINDAALAELLELKVDHLARVASDHCPLLISFGSSARRPAEFKYLRIWHKHPHFLDVVHESWKLEQHANTLLNFVLKLQALCRRLQGWNWNVFGNTNIRLRELSTQVPTLETQHQAHPFDNDILQTLMQAKQALVTTQQSHFQMLADKANANWIAEGDRNSVIFLSLINTRRSRNRVFICQPSPGSL
ncbi:hypothetical protein QQ045_008201 [Rhodiola kirilowii]